MKYTKEEFWTRYYNLPIGGDDRRNFMSEWNQSLEVGDQCTVHLYSDSNPATIIRRTKTSIVVQYDKAERDPNWILEWVPGGFSAVCTNNDDQKWIIERDPNGRTERFFWHGSHGHFACNDGSIIVTPGWFKKYDYNY